MTVLVNDRPEDLDLNRALGEISSERRAKALGYRFDRDRRLSVAVYLLLKEALHRRYDIVGNPRLSVAPNGKPFLTDYPGIHFNLSHCPKAAACVVADCPVGIDVEEIAPVDREVAQRVLNDGEFAAVSASAAPEVAFARYWTQKEALVKLSGRGLEDDRLKALLVDHPDVRLETVEHSDRGFILTTARRLGCARIASEAENAAMR